MAQRFAVMCAEDMLGRSPAPNPRFQALTGSVLQFCKDLPHGKVAPEFFEPTTWRRLSSCCPGAADPVTPPAQAELARKPSRAADTSLYRTRAIVVSPLPLPAPRDRQVRRGRATSLRRTTAKADLKLPPPLFYVSPLEARP